MPPAIVIALVLVLAAGGCGEEQRPDSEAAPDTVAEAREGLLEGDGGKACDQFTEGARRQLSATVAALAGGSPTAPCDQLAGSVKALLGPFERARVEKLSLDVTALQGSTAVVEVRGDPGVPGAGLSVQLVKQGGRWLISGWSGG
jgi:outer membrane murein-binding lipoprotein Lpp